MKQVDDEEALDTSPTSSRYDSVENGKQYSFKNLSSIVLLPVLTFYS